LDTFDEKYFGAARLLPQALRSAALALPPPEQRLAEELRLRAGFPVSAVLPGVESGLEGP
jgi:hypothetical protein